MSPLLAVHLAPRARPWPVPCGWLGPIWNSQRLCPAWVSPARMASFPNRVTVTSGMGGAGQLSDLGGSTAGARAHPCAVFSGSGWVLGAGDLSQGSQGSGHLRSCLGNPREGRRVESSCQTPPRAGLGPRAPTWRALCRVGHRARPAQGWGDAFGEQLTACVCVYKPWFCQLRGDGVAWGGSHRLRGLSGRSC